MIDNHRIIPMIEPIFHFSYEQNKIPFVSSMIHLQPSFGKTPEVFDSINVSFASAKSLLMANTNMMKPLKVESVIGSKAVRINPGKWFYMRLNGSLKRLLVNMFREYHPDFPITLQKPKYRDFTASTSASFPLSDSPKICFIDLYLPRELIRRLCAFLCNQIPQFCVIHKNCFSINLQIFRNPRSRNHQPEQSDDLLDHLLRQSILLRSRSKFLPTLLALSSSVRQYIQLARATCKAVKMTVRRCHKSIPSLWHFKIPFRGNTINHLSSIAWSS